MSTKRVLCKFFAHGACLKGEYCEFSHDWSDQANNVCTFYQKGACSYGSRCRYDHVKVSRNSPVNQQPSSTATRNSPVPPPASSTTTRNSPVPPPASSSTATRNSPVPPPASSSTGTRNSPVPPPASSSTATCNSPVLLPASSSAATCVGSTSLQLLSSGRPLHMGHQTNSSNQRQLRSADVLSDFESMLPWRNEFHLDSLSEDGIDWPSNRTAQYQTSTKLADMPICSFAAAGNCPYGEECHHMHGDLCATCGKMCLHPYRPDEREDHIKLCEKNYKRLEALKRSQEIECSVCLDRVLSKPTAAERKFGLLSECDHPFCILCIRNWRGNSSTSGMDVNSALRACPICRKLSYYVIPSVLWYFSKEEKLEIIDNYKSKLKSIDCKYFDFGTGTCPFGTSCFYKHAYRDGRLEEVILRHLDTDDGTTVIAKNIRLSDFLSGLHL